MKLRTYLIKRTIHMAITLLIVLVLLFVLYRMMPGERAADMMMQPGMTPVQVEMILVRYGYGRYVDYPGEYAVKNYQPDSIGRYAVTVEATSDGTTESFDSYFDVNAPGSVDLLAPQILDIGFVTNATEGSEAEVYLLAKDMGAIRGVDVTMYAPNLVFEEGFAVQHNESFSLSPRANMSDEVNHTYYYSGTTRTDLTVDAGGSTMFQFFFEAEDSARNMATAAIELDLSNGDISKLCNLTLDVPYANELYSYHEIGDTLSLSSTIEGAGTPSFSMLMSDVSESESITLTNSSADVYDGSYVPTENGILTFQIDMGDISATYTYPVNSDDTTLPAPVNGNPSVYPLLTNLVVMPVDQEGNEIDSPEYPFPISGLKLVINATAVDSDGKMSDNVTAYVTRPDGGVPVIPLIHPKYVENVGTLEEFLVYMKTMLVFDFGTSQIYQRPTWEILLERVPSTALLFGSALILSYLIGITVGVVVAWRRGTALEMGTIIVTLFFYSMPIFWFALIMQWIFYAQLGWFPLAGMGGIDPNGDPLHGSAWFIDVLWHLTMPLITLMILGLAGNILLMRTAMLEVMGEDFTTTAKAKGLKERTVVYKHVARNAMLPVVTAMAMSIGGIISGGVLTETIFSWFGMGTLLIEATLTKDFPVVQGAFYGLALITILGNMVADLLYAWLDPRVQL